MANSSSPNTGNQAPADEPSIEANETEIEQQQPLIQHLIELRDRILRSVLVVLAIFLGLYYFANDFYLIISEPLRVYLPEGTSMIATDVASPFLTPFKLTLVMALFLAMPLLMIKIYIQHNLYNYLDLIL